MSRRVSFLLAALAVLAPCSGGAATDALPARLSDTGLYEPGTTRVRADVLAYSPQYPLWSDGATKRRWLRQREVDMLSVTRPDDGAAKHFSSWCGAARSRSRPPIFAN